MKSRDPKHPQTVCRVEPDRRGLSGIEWDEMPQDLWTRLRRTESLWNLYGYTVQDLCPRLFEKFWFLTIFSARVPRSLCKVSWVFPQDLRMTFEALRPLPTLTFSLPRTTSQDEALKHETYETWSKKSSNLTLWHSKSLFFHMFCHVPNESCLDPKLEFSYNRGAPKSSAFY